jgi:predicted oxidoreductase
MNPNDLVNTVNTYNAACAAKVDSQFGRAAANLVPIQTPPFYAMALWPGGEAAFAGPIRNEKGQVCDANSKPIPRLYSAGELGSVRGSTLSAVSQVGECMIFGQISGHNAATEESWTS